MSAPANPKRAKAPKHAHQVWVTFTVFVKREGEKHPWYKHGRCPAGTVQGVSHDQAFHLGERQLAKLLADKFNLAGARP